MKPAAKTISPHTLWWGLRLHVFLGDSLRHFLPSPRRIRNIIGASAVGVAAVLAFATPALACYPVSSHTEVCSDQGQVVITWTINLEESNRSATIQQVVSTPTGSVWSGDTLAKDVKIAQGGKLVAVQTLPAGQTEATLNVSVKLDGRNGSTEWLFNNAQPQKVKLPCSAPSKPATQTPTQPPTATPTETPSAIPSESSSHGGGASVAPSSITSSTSGGASLPVTGSNTGAIVGVAVLLVGAGVGLFFMARRRQQVKFTA